MEMRVLGKTRLSVSALGFGAGSVGGLMVRGERTDQARAIGRALDAGIRYFDTAPSYGDGRSEENLGAALRELGAWNRVTVGTKVRLQPADLSDPVAAIRRSCEASLRRLGCDGVDLLQLHNPIGAGSGAGEPAIGSSRPLPLDVVNGLVAEGMQDVTARGLARHAGCTGLGDSSALHALVEAGTFATVQTYFNAINPSAGTAGAAGGEQDFGALIGAAAAGGVGVIAIRVMAAGALFARPPRHRNAGDPGPALIQGARYDRDLERARGIETLAAELSYDGPLELALRFALTAPGVSTVLVGFSDSAQLEDALRWAERGPVPPDVFHRVISLAQQP